MNLSVLNPVVLFGMAALAVPVLLHLFQRRRFQILDWGAMQFLPSMHAVRRRRFFDEMLLLLLRMGMIATLVLALAAPVSTSALFAPLADAPSRDIVLVLDGSFSMAAKTPGEPTPWDAALAWSHDLIAHLGRNDRVALLVARNPPLLAHGFERPGLRDRLDALSAPRGNPDLRGALAQAWKLLADSPASRKRIIVLTDRQKHGWADPASLDAYQSLGQGWRSDAQRFQANELAVPELHVVDVAAKTATQGNLALAPLVAPRVVGKIAQAITFRSALLLDAHASALKPTRLRTMIDGQPGPDIPLPTPGDQKQGQATFSFQHRFQEVGTHLVSVFLDVDGPDAILLDNEQHVVVEVTNHIPVLLIDGDAQLSPESSTFFLQRALARLGAKGEAPILPPIFSQRDWPASTLAADPEKRPRVLILSDVLRLTEAQQQAIESFLEDGGSVLVAVGERVQADPSFANNHWYREGQGWLPAKLVEVAKANDEPVSPEPRTFQHAALELLKDEGQNSLSQARLQRWWKVNFDAKNKASPIALLNNGDPLLIEKPYRKGRVILCMIPLDRRWQSPLPSRWEYPVLVNELVAYLAGSRTQQFTLPAGHAIRYPAPAASDWQLSTPDSQTLTLRPMDGWLNFGDTGAVGVYRLRGAAPATFVVPPDQAETDLQRCSVDDWSKVAERLPLADATDEKAVTLNRPRHDLWWLFLVALMTLLCGEIVLTRRLALQRGGP
jgi:hypothetical protein